jgi:hypothetical protein
VANVIYSQDVGANATSFTVNPSDPNFTQQMQLGHTYSFELQLRDLRNPAGGTGLANTFSQSRSFFDFTLLPSGSPPKVFLPTVNVAAPGAPPVYEFRAIPVVAGQQVFIDPLVAVGYDYQVGAGDPFFASVTLPTGLGDNMYDLLLWNGSSYQFAANLTGGLEYLFGPGGVDRFRILGIELGDALDPNNPAAFITGLTFVSDGTFSGTQTPLVDFAAGETPLPGTLPLFATGLGALGFLAGRRKREPLAGTPIVR